MIFLEITDKDGLESFIEEAKKVGFLKDVDIKAFSEKQFPIRIPVNLDGFLKLIGNPVIRKTFGRKIETTVVSYLEAAV